MVDNPIATAKIAWLTGMFDPVQPSALRRWVRTHAVPLVPDNDLLNALVLVVNEAVTVSGETTPLQRPVTVELWRGPQELRIFVTCTGMLPTLSRTQLPDDPRMRALWLTMQVNPVIQVTVAGSRITVTLPGRRWS